MLTESYVLKKETMIPKTIFHYTSFEKFKCILQYGTWRFKLSTQSNDLLDTTYIVDIIKNLKIESKNLAEDHLKLLDLLIGYFKRDAYERQFLSYVTCFTGKADSRLLWDAYTINRPVVNEDDVRDYNGVCIGVNRDKLLNILHSKKPEYCDAGFLALVYYTLQQQVVALNFLCKSALGTWDKLKDGKDQLQEAVPTIRTAYSIQIGDYVGKPHFIEMNLKKSFINSMFSYIESVEKTAPFLKHQFWEEENEYRAALNLHISKKPSHDYIDININEELIDFIILGPTFSDREEEVIRKIKDAKLDFNKVSKKQSVGTGIIQMK
ncbi:DUF2971 domain-containing protein [Metallumcola ferriviriculae]|uniref:DUF2971 domain-containing protein n=1 Tax=Metallumcola ferriviriculae TaxID=3039180 RepID=A0AAU0UI19_9FIRM|nr:DUF2971 domain-containing protein [Desulfitibacteraceae bacterium MK1]